MQFCSVYCDESVYSGRLFSNFYGGVLIRDKDKDFVINRLYYIKNLRRITTSEFKWEKINSSNIANYIKFIDEFFKLINDDKIRIRVKFINNADKIPGGTINYYRNTYQNLYLSFLRHAFGFKYLNNYSISFFFDTLPLNNAKKIKFFSKVSYLSKENNWDGNNIIINPDNIREVVSHDEILIQVIDVVIGSINFMNNGEYTKLRDGLRKRTIAKNIVAQYIHFKLLELDEYYNPSKSTYKYYETENELRLKFRQWVLKPTNRHT